MCVCTNSFKPRYSREIMWKRDCPCLVHLLDRELFSFSQHVMAQSYIICIHLDTQTNDRAGVMWAGVGQGGAGEEWGRGEGEEEGVVNE